MLTEERKLGLIGLVTLAITERKRLNRTEAAICGLLKLVGIAEREAEDAAAEVTYNAGGEPIAAAEELLKTLGLECKQSRTPTDAEFCPAKECLDPGGYCTNGDCLASK